MFYSFSESPFGNLLLVSDGCNLNGLFLPNHKHGFSIGTDWQEDEGAPPFPIARRQLGDYFSGTRKVFDLPLKTNGTLFQENVWQILKSIPYGTTSSYKDIALQLNKPDSIRAVGGANGRNPISIIIPCHRVLGSDGKLTGYGGGIERKAALLDFERAVITNGPIPFMQVVDI